MGRAPPIDFFIICDVNPNTSKSVTSIQLLFLDFSSEPQDLEMIQREKTFGELRSGCERRKAKVFKTQAVLHDMKAQKIGNQTTNVAVLNV